MQHALKIPTPHAPVNLARAVLAALAFVLLVSGTTVAFGATYYVSPSATAAGDGSAQSPWKSINAAFQSGKVKGGEEIFL